jgi:hypothetical protein
MLLFLNFLNKKKAGSQPKQSSTEPQKPKRTSVQIAIRKGELGEYKIDI